MDITSTGTLHMKNSKNKLSKRKRDRVMKVVYISSPMKVKTSASKFRALVQELTGRHSDVSRFMELNGADDSQTVPDNVDVRGLRPSFSDDYASSVVVPIPPRESPASSDSYLEGFDDHAFASQMDRQLSELMFSSSLFNDSSGDLDVLGSYDSL